MATLFKRQTKSGDRWVARVRRQGNDVTESFATRRQAAAWARDQDSLLETTRHARGLGPKHTTLAQALRDYAHLYSVGKKGVRSEVDRINRYLTSAGLPGLSVGNNANNTVALFDRATDGVRVPDEFKKRFDDRARLRHKTNAIRKRLANMSVAALSPHHFRELCNAMTAEGLTGDTARLEFALLRNLFNRAIDEWGWTTIGNPLRGFKLPRRNPGRDRRLSQDEEVRLFEALNDGCDKWLKSYVELAIETAMRRGELIVGCTWDDVDLDGRYITLRDTKNGSGRRVPLTRRAVEVLAALPRHAEDARIFAITANALKCAWRRVCRKARIEGLRVHDLRHESLSRHAKRLSGNAFLLKKVSGHKTLAMLDRYVNLDVDDVLEAWEESEPPSPPALPEVLPENVVPLPRRNGKLARGLNAIGGRS